MTLKTIRIDGYKPFSSPARLDLKKLTVMFGTNSAGKSSLLRLLPLIADSVRLKPKEPFAASGAAINGASVSGLFSKYSSTPVMMVAFDFDGSNSGILTAEYKLRNFTKGHSSVVAIEELTLIHKSGTHQIKVDLDTLVALDRGEVLYRVAGQESAELEFEGFVPKETFLATPQFSELILGLHRELISLANVVWLGVKLQ